MSVRKVETDVLVVGGGGAGFRAAIAAREAGARVTLISKGPLARCGATPMAGADFTLDGLSLSKLGFPGAPDDTFEKAFNDIVTQGYYLNSQKLVEQYLTAAPARLKELIDWGLKITFSEERAIFTSGIGIMDTLLDRAKSLSVNFMADTMILELLTENGQISGAFGLDVRNGDYIHFKTNAMVMATGGWHKAFWPNTGMRDLSGEGIAMAHRAGADIGNMEFITFCCNVLLEPPMWLGSIATYVISLLAGGTLTNRDGEEFLNRYDPLMVKIGTGMEWNKSFVSYVTMKEVNAGKGGPQGGIFYGRGDVPWEEFEEAATRLMPKWKYKAMDLRPLGEKLKAGESVEVGAAVEYFEGGIKVNERFETNVAGLYAAGECTLGPFGANRVFSAITEMLVHGEEAGKNAGKWAVKEMGLEPDAEILRSHEDQIETLRHRTTGLRIPEVRRKVQKAAHKALGPIRNPADLENFLKRLDTVKTDELPNLSVSDVAWIYNKEIIDALELGNMLTLLEAASKSALFRTESRGVHYRDDFPDCDNDNWLKETIIKQTEDGFKIETENIQPIHKSLPNGKMPYLDMMKTMMTSRSDIGGHH